MSQPRESWEMWHDDYYDQFEEEEHEQDDIDAYKRERDEGLTDD